MTNAFGERSRGGAAVPTAEGAVREETGGTVRAPLSAWLRYFLWLGTVGFGDPAALVGYMQHDVVERRGWIRPADYTEGLALAQLAPGPLAAQLAIYLGWVRAGVLGAMLTGVAFVGPSFVLVVALAGAALVLAHRAVVDVPTGLICLATLGVLFIVKRVPEPLVIVITGIIGVVIKGA